MGLRTTTAEQQLLLVLASKLCRYAWPMLYGAKFASNKMESLFAICEGAV